MNTSEALTALLGHKAEPGTEHIVNGKAFTLIESNGCDPCHFFWQDGGLYDACIHPDTSTVISTCGRECRANGQNFAWIPANTTPRIGDVWKSNVTNHD